MWYINISNNKEKTYLRSWTASLGWAGAGLGTRFVGVGRERGGGQSPNPLQPKVEKGEQTEIWDLEEPWLELSSTPFPWVVPSTGTALAGGLGAAALRLCFTSALHPAAPGPFSHCIPRWDRTVLCPWMFMGQHSPLFCIC